MTDTDATDLRERIRRARGKFASMAGCYCLGVFNDNFYKQAALLTAVGLGMPDKQSWVGFWFTLPYLLFAAPAGWLADRFSKGRIVILAKALEVVAMGCGAVGIWTTSWPLIMMMAFLMGAQSCLFSPALNGSIPELYPASYVTQANSVLKVVTTASILAGFALAGVVLDLGGAAVVAVCVVCIAIAGLTVSFGTAHRPAANPSRPFPWTGPLDTFRELRRIWHDAALRRIVIVATFIWSLGSLQILLINPLGRTQFGWSAMTTSLLLAVELVGVALGGAAAARWARGPRWQRVLGPALLAMGVLLALVAFAPRLGEAARYAMLMALLLAGGAAGGLVLVPCEAFIQVHPPGHRKGAVIAAANFAIFSGILLSMLVGYVLNKTLQPTQSFALVGGASAVVGAWALVSLRGEGRS